MNHLVSIPVTSATGQALVCTAASPSKKQQKGKNLPLVLLFPDVMGNKRLDQGRAVVAAQELGCHVAVVDLYGQSLTPSEREDREKTLLKAFDLMNELLADPVALRATFVKVRDACVQKLQADPRRVAAMGFCFGGACVMEALRSSLSGLKGIVSFHGALDAVPMTTLTGAAPPPVRTKAVNAYAPDCKVLILHGNDDPLGPAPMVRRFEDEMKAAKVKEWALFNFGNTLHGFTAPGPGNEVIGFNAFATRRAWVAAFDFLREALALELPKPALSVSTLHTGTDAWLSKL